MLRVNAACTAKPDVKRVTVAAAEYQQTPFIGKLTTHMDTTRDITSRPHTGLKSAASAAAATIALAVASLPGAAHADTIPGTVSTFAGPTSQGGAKSDNWVDLEMGYSGGLAANSQGEIYIVASDSDYEGPTRVYKTNGDGQVESYMDDSAGASTGDGGPAESAGFNEIESLAVGPDDSLYISDPGARNVRQVTPDGQITTVAGGGDQAPGDEPVKATDAQLGWASQLATGPDGTLYITDKKSKQVYAVDDSGMLSVFAGNGRDESVGDGGPATEAGFDLIPGITVADDGTVYLATTFPGWDVDTSMIRAIDTDGTIDTVVRSGKCHGDDPDIGHPDLCTIVDLEMSPDGRLYAADHDAHEIYIVSGDGDLDRLAGDHTFVSELAFLTDGDLLWSETVNLDNYKVKHVQRFAFEHERDATDAAEDNGLGLGWLWPTVVGTLAALTVATVVVILLIRRRRAVSTSADQAPPRSYE